MCVRAFACLCIRARVLCRRYLIRSSNMDEQGTQKRKRMRIKQDQKHKDEKGWEKKQNKGKRNTRHRRDEMARRLLKTEAGRRREETEWRGAAMRRRAGLRCTTSAGDILSASGSHPPIQLLRIPLNVHTHTLMHACIRRHTCPS